MEEGRPGLFSPQAWVVTGTLNSQIDNGLYTLKRVLAYLKKVVEIQKDFATRLDSVTKHEIEKKGEKLDQDGMSETLNCFKSLQSLYNSSSGAHLVYCQDMSEKVLEPLATFQTSAAKRLKELADKETQLKTRAKELADTTVKRRAKAKKDWEVLRALDYQSFQGTYKDSKTKKKEVLFEKQVLKTQQSFKAVEILVRESLKLSREYTQLIEQLKELEFSRLEKLQEAIKLAAEIDRAAKIPGEKKWEILRATVEGAKPKEQLADWCERKSVMVADRPLLVGLPVFSATLTNKAEREALFQHLAVPVTDAIKWREQHESELLRQESQLKMSPDGAPDGVDRPTSEHGSPFGPRSSPSFQDGLDFKEADVTPETALSKEFEGAATAPDTPQQHKTPSSPTHATAQHTAHTTIATTAAASPSPSLASSSATTATQQPAQHSSAAPIALPEHPAQQPQQQQPQPQEAKKKMVTSRPDNLLSSMAALSAAAVAQKANKVSSAANKPDAVEKPVAAVAKQQQQQQPSAAQTPENKTDSKAKQEAAAASSSQLQADKATDRTNMPKTPRPEKVREPSSTPGSSKSTSKQLNMEDAVEEPASSSKAAEQTSKPETEALEASPASTEDSASKDATADGQKKQQGVFARCTNDFPKQDANDLDLKKGDIVWIFWKESPEMADGDNNVWCQGYLVTNGKVVGKPGTFASSFVKEIGSSPTEVGKPGASLPAAAAGLAG